MIEYCNRRIEKVVETDKIDLGAEIFGEISRIEVFRLILRKWFFISKPE